MSNFDYFSIQQGERVKTQKVHSQNVPVPVAQCPRCEKGFILSEDQVKWIVINVLRKQQDMFHTERARIMKRLFPLDGLSSNRRDPTI